MSDTSRSWFPEAARNRAHDMLIDHEGNVGRIYADSRGIPTIGAGISLADTSGHPWKNLDDILRRQGLDPDEIVPGGGPNGQRRGDAVRNAVSSYALGKGQNDARIEQPHYTRKGEPVFYGPPPLGINLTSDQVVARLMPLIDQEAEAVRNKVGWDASGNYYFDKLKPDEKAALVDAYHNSPALIGKGVTDAIRNGDYMSAFWQMKDNVKDPHSRRRLDDAKPFLANHSPFENPFNSDSYTNEVLEKAGDEIRRALAPVPPGPTSDAGPNDSGSAVADASDGLAPAQSQIAEMIQSGNYDPDRLNALLDQVLPADG